MDDRCPGKQLRLLAYCLGSGILATAVACGVRLIVPGDAGVVVWVVAVGAVSFAMGVAYGEGQAVRRLLARARRKRG